MGMPQSFFVCFVAGVYDQCGNGDIYEWIHLWRTVFRVDDDQSEVPFHQWPICQVRRPSRHLFDFLVGRLPTIPKTDSRKRHPDIHYCCDVFDNGVFVSLWIQDQPVLFFFEEMHCGQLPFVATMGRFRWASYDYVFVSERIHRFRGSMYWMKKGVGSGGPRGKRIRVWLDFKEWLCGVVWSTVFKI